MDDIELVDINIGRDAALATIWINAPGGVEMLRLMGMIMPDDFTTTVAEEAERSQQIITNPDELAWMIDYDGEVVGIVEVHLTNQEGRPAPNISIMIGDASARGRGIGTRALQIAINELARLGHKSVYARALTHNSASQKMLTKVGFVQDAEPCADADGLHWQNYTMAISDFVAY